MRNIRILSNKIIIIETKIGKQSKSLPRKISPRQEIVGTLGITSQDRLKNRGDFPALLSPNSGQTVTLSPQGENYRACVGGQPLLPPRQSTKSPLHRIRAVREKRVKRRSLPDSSKGVKRRHLAQSFPAYVYVRVRHSGKVSKCLRIRIRI